MITLTINGKSRSVDVAADTPLLWVLRDTLGLTGTKFGCGAGLCGACTVHLNGEAVRSCQLPISAAAGKKITTIEGLSMGEKLHPVQEQFIEHDAMQCGFCTPGMIMSCAALLAQKQQPTLEDVQAATSGNLCRCGTYPKVFEATLAAAKNM